MHTIEGLLQSHSKPVKPRAFGHRVGIRMRCARAQHARFAAHAFPTTEARLDATLQVVEPNTVWMIVVASRLGCVTQGYPAIRSQLGTQTGCAGLVHGIRAGDVLLEII